MFKLLLIALFIPLQCFAISEEYLTNLVIQGDILEINLKDKQANLQGNIKIESDSLSITADGMSITFIQNSQTNELKNLIDNTDKIERFRLYVNKGYIKASLKTHEKTYQLKCKEIIGNIHDKQIIISDTTIYDGMNHIVGEKVTYDMHSKQLSVKSNQNNKVKISIKDNGSQKIK